MQKLIAILLAVMPLNLYANCETVTMQYHFEIEGADFTHAAAWIGGWSAAIIASSKGDTNICVPECGVLVTKEIVDILNKKFAGQTISAETASAAIWPELKRHLTCKKADTPNKPLNAIAPKDGAPH